MSKNRFNHLTPPTTVDLSTVSVRGQRWYVTPEGIRYPSVTTVLSSEPKSAIIAWKESMGAVKADKETKRCADRGTAVHDMLEKYVNNDPDYINGHTTQNVKLFNRTKLALKKVDNVRIQEVALYSNMLKLAGRVDCVAEHNGILSIIDFKTSTKFKPLELVGDYMLQCTAYAIMYNEMFGTAIDNIVIIIGVEKEIVPTVYTDKIDAHIEPLLKRISKFHNGVK